MSIRAGARVRYKRDRYVLRDGTKRRGWHEYPEVPTGEVAEPVVSDVLTVRWEAGTYSGAVFSWELERL